MINDIDNQSLTRKSITDSFKERLNNVSLNEVKINNETKCAKKQITKKRIKIMRGKPRLSNY